MRLRPEWTPAWLLVGCAMLGACGAAHPDYMGQQAFATPREAVEAFASAAESSRMEAILGPQASDLLSSGGGWLVAGAIVLAGELCGCKAPFSRAKTDRVFLENGDRLTGEIKQLEQGKLRLEASDLSTVYIEWNKIVRIESRYGFAVEDQAGSRHFGQIMSRQDGRLTIREEDGPERELGLEEVVEMLPIDEDFWPWIDGNLSLGHNYNKGSDVAQAIVSGTINYRERVRVHSLDFSSTLTRDSTNCSTSRNTFDLGSVRYWDRWFAWGAESLEQNESLGLDLRALVSAGAGRSQVHTGRNRLDLGLAVSAERRSEAEDNPGELEGVFRASCSVYMLESKDVDSDFVLDLVPGIIQSGRVYGGFDASISRELFENVTFKLSACHCYDNQPGDEETEVDCGIHTSLGWSF